MARAYASTVIDAPVEKIWAIVRDFNGLPNWVPVVTRSRIEDGLAADVVGCVRSFHLRDGTHVRERLLELDDARRSLSYNFETPAFPVGDYVATLRVMPVTAGDRSFVEWEATFEEPAAERGRYEDIVSRDVFAVALASLAAKAPALPMPEGARRWKGRRPAKVFASTVIRGPVGKVWPILRDFAGMGAWHPGITRMRMLDGKRADQVGGVRDFLFGDGRLHEELLHLCDRTRSFSYRINLSPLPWLDYVAGPRIWPITDRDQTFAVWTADWDANPNDDLELIPKVHNDVFLKAFETIDAKYFGGGAR
jgi:uncharacterized protein YndB with AHSA1/START domain